MIITSLAEAFKTQTNKGSYFYWEEDEWYDFLSVIPKQIKFKKKVELTSNEIDEMQNILNDLKKFWEQHCDFRFGQMLSLIQPQAEKAIMEIDSLNQHFWQSFFNKLDL